MTPPISNYAQKKKIQYFFKNIPKSSKILEVGCGNYWLGDYLKHHGWKNYLGLDLSLPADIVGNIKNWKKLGLKKNSFDIIVAFEIVEHTDCFQELYDLLKPNGQLFLTSPIPHFDNILKLLETVGLTQKRTSPHDHLIYFDKIPRFLPLEIKTAGFLSQWGKFTSKNLTIITTHTAILIKGYKTNNSGVYK